LNKPLTNILSSTEDLKLASAKIDEIQNMIHEEEKRKFEYFSLSFSTWGSVMISIVLFFTCICCSCCFCKCCRRCGFWLWDRWTPKECLRQTREKCCIINNFSADHISYTEVPPSPLQTPPGTPSSVRSLPLSLTAPNPSRVGRSEAAGNVQINKLKVWKWLGFQSNQRTKKGKKNVKYLEV
jgi:hypothetical protein